MNVSTTNLSNCNVGSFTHGSIEVACRLPEDEISHSVSFVGFDESEISSNGLLHDVISAVERLGLNNKLRRHDLNYSTKKKVTEVISTNLSWSAQNRNRFIFVILYRNSTILNTGAISSWSEKCRYPRTTCSYPFS